MTSALWDHGEAQSREGQTESVDHLYCAGARDQVPENHTGPPGLTPH